MVEEPVSEYLARRFLLSELGEPERLEIERRMIESGEVQELLALAESELIDAYLEGGLAPRDRTRFEERYLSHADGVRKVELARLLRRWAVSGAGERREPAAVGRGSASRAWQVAAAVLLAACLGGLSWQVWQGRRELADKEAEVAAARQRALSLEERLRAAEGQLAEARRQLAEQRTAAERRAAQPPREPLRRPVEASLLLLAGVVRGAAAGQTLAVPGGVETVRLDLAWPVDREAVYRAAIEAPDGAEVWRAEGLAAATRDAASVLVLRLPASVLAPGDYILRLEARDRGAGWEGVADYSFRVTAGN